MEQVNILLNMIVKNSCQNHISHSTQHYYPFHIILNNYYITIILNLQLSLKTLLYYIIVLWRFTIYIIVIYTVI